VFYLHDNIVVDAAIEGGAFAVARVGFETHADFTLKLIKGFHECGGLRNMPSGRMRLAPRILSNEWRPTIELYYLALNMPPIPPTTLPPSAANS
jgi:hypothetical protein